MADFRKSFFVLAALVLILGTSAFAQPALQCTANAGVPPILRAEGLTEQIGDIVLNCTGGTPTLASGSVPQSNIQIFLNTSVTSRLVSATQAEALLILDDQAPATQFLCPNINGCTFAGTAGAVVPYTPVVAGVGRPSVYQGQVNGSQSVLFLGVPIDPPGSVGTRVIRITNIRANATAVAPGGSGTPGQVAALISASPQNVLPINNPQQIVGYVQTGMTFSTSNVGNTGGLGTVGFAQCASNNTSGTTRTATGLLRFTEGFATAFKTRASNFDTTGATSPVPLSQAVPGVNLTTGGITAATETGFYNPALTAPYNIAGLADYGTRLQAVFNNIPTGLNIFVGNRELTATSSATAKAVLVTFDAASFLPVTPQTTTTIYLSNGLVFAGGTTQLAVANNSATATWEVTAANALVVENIDFPFFVNYSANAAANTPAPGTGTVNGRFAPISTVTTASQTASIPRFVDTSKAVNLYTIRLCVTNLMFPFVTNQAGFDTGLAIANTTTDPFGTTPQTGTCTLNFYGENAPSALTSPAVASGTVWSTLASTSSPNFQGYVIAVCKFQYGHGFAFVSDLGARTIAMGYLALVMPDQGRANNGTTPGITLNSSATGELLGN